MLTTVTTEGLITRVFKMLVIVESLFILWVNAYQIYTGVYSFVIFN